MEQDLTFLPQRSTSCVATNDPSNCIAPTIMADSFGDRLDPVSPNMNAV